MHEMSLVVSLLDLVERHAPPNAVVRKVVIEAGPLQGIDDQAMQWAWQAAILGTQCEKAELQIQYQPWQMLCSACARRWSAPDRQEACTCGALAYPVEGRDLLLKSLTVED